MVRTCFFRNSVDFRNSLLIVHSQRDKNHPRSSYTGGLAAEFTCDYSPSGYVFGFVALERHVVVDVARRTAAVLRGDAVPAYVELLTVVRVCERRVRQDPAVRADHVAVRTRETVGERVCAKPK